MTDTLPILYSFRRCPYAMRARLAMRASGVKCELREIVLRDKAPEFLEASPKGTVPVLVLQDGTVLEESLDLMNWALAQHDPENWLQPEQGNLDQMRALIDRCEIEFKRHLDRYKYSNRYDDADASAEKLIAGKFLSELEGRLATHQYLFGNKPALADMAIAPFVRQFANVDRQWFDDQSWPNVIEWLNRFLESVPFQSIMEKYPKWQAGDPVTHFG